MRWNPRGNAGKKGGTKNDSSTKGLYYNSLGASRLGLRRSPAPAPSRASSSQQRADRPPCSNCPQALLTFSIAKLYHALSAGASITFRAFPTGDERFWRAGIPNAARSGPRPPGSPPTRQPSSTRQKLPPAAAARQVARSQCGIWSGTAAGGSTSSGLIDAGACASAGNALGVLCKRVPLVRHLDAGRRKLAVRQRTDREDAEG